MSELPRPHGWGFQKEIRISVYIVARRKCPVWRLNPSPNFQRNLMAPENRQFQEGCAAVIWVDRMHNTRCGLGR